LKGYGIANFILTITSKCLRFYEDFIKICPARKSARASFNSWANPTGLGRFLAQAAEAFTG
jgi:hypothetical protein